MQRRSICYNENMEHTLIDKLKLNRYSLRAVLNTPASFHLLDSWLPHDTQLLSAYDCIFTFVYDIADMKQFVEHCIKTESLKPSGYLFIAYPKKNNKIYPTFIHRDEIFPGLNVGDDGYIGRSTYKFSRMLALDETFTLVGVQNLPTKPTARKVSQSSRDYVTSIPELAIGLDDETKKQFLALTPGYQRDWARYIYSSRNESTRQLHIQHLERCLKNGYKSIALARKAHFNFS